MDSLSLILNALIQGAASELAKVTSDATKTAYSALKSYVLGKYPKVPIEQLEKDPADQSTQDFAKLLLEREGLQHDSQVLRLAERLVATIATRDPHIAKLTGNTVSVEGTQIRIQDNRGQLLVGNIIGGDVKFEHHSHFEAALRPMDRVTSFRRSPAYSTLAATAPPLNFPIAPTVTAFLTIIPIVIALRVAPERGFDGWQIILLPFVAAFFWAAYKLVAHFSVELRGIPGIVTNKNQPEKGMNSIELKTESGETIRIECEGQKINSIGIGDMGVAFVSGANLLVEFRRYDEPVAAVRASQSNARST
jgi:hypothetical protein